MVTLTCVPINCFATCSSIVSARRVERHAAHHDGPELREIDPAVPLDRQLISRGLVAVELDVQRIAGSDDIVDRNLDIGDRREGAGNTLEQVVAERLQRLLPIGVSRSSVSRTRNRPELGIGTEPLRRLGRGEPGERDRGQARHLEHTELIELIRDCCSRILCGISPPPSSHRPSSELSSGGSG